MKNSIQIAKKLYPVVFVLVVLAITIFPILWVFIMSIAERGEMLLLGRLSDVRLSLNSYRSLLANQLFTSSFINSLFITAIGAGLALILALPTSYYLTMQSLHEKQGKSKNAFNLWLLLTYMLPEFLFIIPMYILYQKIGLYDTYVGLALLYQVHTLPFSIWMIKNFFENNIPVSISEAANIDGASHGVILWRIYTPLAKPGIAAVAILNMIWIWNELAIALSLSFYHAQTITVGVASFRGYGSINYGAMAAASIVAILPMLLASIFVQKHILKGLTAGAIK